MLKKNQVRDHDANSSGLITHKKWVLDYRCTGGRDCHDVAKDLKNRGWSVHRALIDEHSFKAFNSKLTHDQVKEYVKDFSTRSEIYESILYLES